MKKMTFTIITLCTMIACVDQNYDLNKYNSEIDATVKIDDKQEPVGVQDFIKSGASVDEEGNLFVKSTETATTVEDACKVSDITSGKSVSIKGADLTINLPVSKNFPSDDVFDALDAPYFEIKVSNEKKLDFTYSAKIKVNGKEFPFSAEIPAIKSEVVVVVSEYGDIVPAEEEAKGSRVNATPISNFRQIYKGSPKEIQISDVELQGHSVKAAMGDPRNAGEETISFTFKGSSVCPLEFKKNVKFTVRDTIMLDKVDLSEYVGFKKVKVSALVHHNFPFKMEPTLIYPEEVVASSSSLAGAPYPDYVDETVSVTGSFPNGIKKYYDKAILDLSVCYVGSEETGSIRSDMTFQLTLKEYTVTMD